MKLKNNKKYTGTISQNNSVVIQRKNVNDNYC